MAHGAPRQPVESLFDAGGRQIRPLRGGVPNIGDQPTNRDPRANVSARRRATSPPVNPPVLNIAREPSPPPAIQRYGTGQGFASDEQPRTSATSWDIADRISTPPPERMRRPLHGAQNARHHSEGSSDSDSDNDYDFRRSHSRRGHGGSGRTRRDSAGRQAGSAAPRHQSSRHHGHGGSSYSHSTHATTQLARQTAHYPVYNSHQMPMPGPSRINPISSFDPFGAQQGFFASQHGFFASNRPSTSASTRQYHETLYNYDYENRGSSSNRYHARPRQ